jgi:nitroreductase
LEKVKDRIARDSQSSQAHPDIPYPPMSEPFSSRQRELGKQMNAYLAARQSGAGKNVIRPAGAQFFGAPDAIIVSAEREICPRAFLGLGMVAQTIALAALNFGLGTCIMSMVTYWPEVYRELFEIPDSRLIAYGIAIGYPDLEAPVNSFPRNRLELDSFVHWYGV